MMENGSHVFVHGVSIVDLKLTSGNIIRLKLRLYFQRPMIVK
jgi:hypothetical protein